MEFLVPLGESVARLGEGRLCLSKLVTVRGLSSWHVWDRFRGPVYDCLWLASGPLYDWFESVIA